MLQITGKGGMRMRGRRVFLPKNTIAKERDNYCLCLFIYNIGGGGTSADSFPNVSKILYMEQMVLPVEIEG